MKNLSLVLNFVLLIAVAILFYLHFSERSQINPVQSKPTNKLVDIGKDAIAIAYVNSDTLVKNYAYYDQIKKVLEGKRGKLEKDYETQARALENEMANYQKTAPTLSQDQLRTLEENLMMKRQRLMQYQEQLSQQLVQEEAKLNDSLYNKITSYLKGYSKDHQYDIVFGYSRGAGILFAHDSLEITSDVLKGINEEYKLKSKK